MFTPSTVQADMSIKRSFIDRCLKKAEDALFVIQELGTAPNALKPLNPCATY
jgi:hypothetical protein